MTKRTFTVDDADLNLLQKLLYKMFSICGPTGPTAPTGPSGDSRTGINYGYYGGGDPATFADHCNFTHIGSWGDWVSPTGRQDLTNSIVAAMHAAVSNGINRIMITTDWCVFNSQWQLLPVAKAQQQLTAFFDVLLAEKLLGNVAAIYAIDEPDVNGVSDGNMYQANSVLRDVASWYWGINATPPGVIPPVVTTYGVNGTPGIGSFDWCGFDNYGTPIFTNGDYDRFVAKLTPNQRVTLVPGGADPWRDNPAPFNAKAQSDSRVVLILPFLWMDNPDPTNIEHNGMAPQYRAVGAPIKAAYP